MTDTGKNLFFDEIDPTSILVREYLIKYIYCCNKFKEFTTKLELLLERVKNSSIRSLIDGMYEKIKFLIEQLKDIEKNDNLLIKYINTISEVYKLIVDFDNFLIFYSYQ
ncbi:MAG: hypothetical protein LBF97_03130 [Elusimicrobiota bacterium]|jgi:hypothetical protein|nr:hypothetical protein [Elusimicrobiota bacterium]